MYTSIQLENTRVVIQYLSEIIFRSSAKKGNIVKIKIDVLKFGITAITLKCEAQNIMTCETIITIDHTAIVSSDADGRLKAHSKTAIA